MRTVMLTALFATSTVSVHAHAVSGERPANRVQLELAGVLPIGDGSATVIVLRSPGSRTILPMLLPGDAGRALASDLQTHRAPALLGVTLRALGARVREVELQGSDEEVRGGRARVVQGQKEVEVEARAPELVALAAAIDAPIYIDRKLFEAAGLTPEDIDRARRRLEERESRTWL
jgi:bifunctional DNase/RNase